MLVQLLTISALAVSYVSAQNATNVTIASVTQAFDNASIVPDGEYNSSGCVCQMKTDCFSSPSDVRPDGSTGRRLSGQHDQRLCECDAGDEFDEGA